MNFFKLKTKIFFDDDDELRKSKKNRAKSNNHDMVHINNTEFFLWNFFSIFFSLKEKIQIF